MKKFISIILGILFLGIMRYIAFADEPLTPHSYKKMVSAEKYIFVMLRDRTYLSGKALEKEELEMIYPHSGLYLNDGSTVPLWTIDWYAFPSEVYLSSDGGYLVRMGPWPSLKGAREVNLEQLAVAFYEKGKLLQQYYILELVRNPEALPCSISHFEWCKEVSFDDKTGQFTIITLDNQKYVFDISSGEIIKGD
jgi:hypothetical protein